MSRKKYDGAKKVIGIILFILYLIAMCYILFFMEWRSRNLGGVVRYNATPFREIKRYAGLIKTMPYVAFTNLAGNVLIFMPYGALMTFFRRKTRTVILSVTLSGFFFSCAIELTQLFTRVGCCDVDDVILNTMGTLLGSIVYYIHYHRRKKR